jgi:hypothetical protein
MFWHNGGNVGFRSLYVGDPVSGDGSGPRPTRLEKSAWTPARHTYLGST